MGLLRYQPNLLQLTSGVPRTIGEGRDWMTGSADYKKSQVRDWPLVGSLIGRSEAVGAVPCGEGRITARPPYRGDRSRWAFRFGLSRV